jgi:CHASE2 domain-containing sensor protein/nitrogen-specific signal transduction histidine kinase
VGASTEGIGIIMAKWQRQHLHQWMRIGLSAFGSTALVMGLQLTGAFQQLELAVLDQWFRWKPIEAPEDRIVLVTIDEPDLAKLNQLPLSDATLATVLTRIKQQQPRVIGLDVYRNLPVEPGHQALLQVFKTTPNLIGVEKTLGGSDMPSVDPPPILRDRKQIAASDLVLDPDGKVRRGLVSLRINSLWGHRSRTIHTLGTRLALEYLKAEKIEPKTLGTNSRFQLGRVVLAPLDKNAGGYVQADVGGYQLLSNFRRLPNHFASISLSDVLQDKIPARFMRDRIVVIGSTAESLNDRFFTPFTINTHTIQAGVEIHADLASQLISGALDGRPLLQGIPDWIDGVLILLATSVGVGLGLGLKLWRQAFWMIPLSMGSMIAGGYGLFLLGWWVPIVSPIMGLSIAGLTTRSYLTWRRLKESHQALQDYAKTLEQKIQERTQTLIDQNFELEQAKQEAEAANQAKNRFLASMNHELRTPLSIILSSSELLSYDQDLTPKQIDRLDKINRSVQYLLDLINNVLELAKLEAAAETLDLETVSLQDLLQNLEEMIQPQAALKGLTLVFHYSDTLETIQTDERKLRQVLINLLNNAIKFTHEGTIALRVFPLWFASSPVLRFEVEDTGVGIAFHEIDLLFKAFVQTESGRKSGKGTGLGLSISAQFVRLLGGTLQVNSTLSSGSIFWFELPLQVATEDHTGLTVTENLAHQESNEIVL